MSDKKNSDKYFEWMVEKSGGWDQRSLLAILHSVPFEWKIPHDENREEDGAYQRWIFHEDTGEPVPRDFAHGTGCSVLEMMLGVADAMHELMYEPDNGSCTQIWMQTFLENMQLGQLTDIEFERDTDGCCRYVEDILEHFLERTYARDGTGSMFILRGTGLDVRKMEIWYQMQTFCDRIMNDFDGFEEV